MKGISFIMCCHNSARLLATPLESVLRQETDAPFEVILVDNNCTDDTVAVARETARRAGQSQRLRIVRETASGLVHARRAGSYAAKHEVLVFVDDDNIISRNWVDIILPYFAQHPDAGILGGNNSARFESGSRKPAWFGMVARSFACGPLAKSSGDLSGTRKSVFGAGMCIRKSVIIGIYENGTELFLVGRKGKLLLSGDDSELCMRAILRGWRICYLENLRLDHVMPAKRMNWNTFRKTHQGHYASLIILQLYMKAIDQEPLPDRIDIAISILRDSYRLIRSHRLTDMLAEGNWAAVQLAELIGRIRGYLHFFPRYGKIRNQIARMGRERPAFPIHEIREQTDER